MQQSEHYDRYQFDNRRQYLVSQDTCIDYSDAPRMHMERHVGNQPWVPPFAMDDKKLQHILVVRAWQATRGSKRPEPRINRDVIDKAATAHSLRGYTIRPDASAIQHEMAENHRAAIRRAGSYLALHAAIAYRAWRLGMRSNEIAADMDLTPVCVRQHIFRLRAIARKLGYDCGKQSKLLGTVRKPKAHEVERPR